MIDLKLLRKNPELMKDNIKKRNLDIDLDAFLELDKKLLQLKEEVNLIRAKKNSFSRILSTLPEKEKEAKLSEMRDIGEVEKRLTQEIKDLEERHNEMLYRLPNFLDPTAPVGLDDSGNVVEKRFGEPAKFHFEAKTHYEIGEEKGWIDFKKGAGVSGTRFWFLKGDLVSLQFAIINYALSKFIEKGFIPILPPVLVREFAMFGTGFLPAGEDGVYRVNPEDDDLYLVGTAEVPLTSYHAGEIIEDLNTPIKYVGYSSCFRKEAGSAGKDTKGILRGHQFDKIEMVCFCKPEESSKLHDEMVDLEEQIWQELGIPYQKVNICSGDLGNPAMKKYDLEAWMPGEKRFREVTSCSNVGEYQSRRLGIRYRDSEGKIRYAHTLNGTVVALSRCLAAIIENYQTSSGDVIVPEILRPFMGGKEKI